MKVLKPLAAITLCTAMGVSAWIYYPKYKIERIKKVAQSEVNHSISYLEYFSSSEDDTILHLALGDSVIKGVGAEKEKDFVTLLSKKLERESKKSVSVLNKGVPGQTSNELNKSVQNGTYNDAIAKANIITLNIGGNDILRAVKKGNFYEALKSFDSLKKSYVENLNSVINQIRAINSDAVIIVSELYNPFNRENEVYNLANQFLPKWNVHLYEVAQKHSSIVVLETTKVINGDHPHYLSADGIHPNSVGYEAITQQAFRQLKFAVKS